jgi:DHA1 family multidrug resistance protein-like MFS transporter
MKYYRRNLLVLSLTCFITTCGFNQVVPFLPMFINELGVTDGVAFWSGVTLSAQTVAMIVMLPYWGKLADKHGSKLMIIRAGICGALIYLGMSICRTLWQLVLLRVLNGGLTGFVAASITLVGTNTPQPETARSVALIQSAIAFGSITGPVLGSVLANWIGYRGSMLVSGVILVIGVLLVCLLVEERQKVSSCTQLTSLWEDFYLAVKKPVLVTALSSNSISCFLTSASQPILILYIQELIGNRMNLFAGPIFSLQSLAIILTNYYWCHLGEQYTFQRIILLGLAGTGFFTVLQGLIHNIWWFTAAYFLAGLFIAAVNPNTSGMIATEVETSFQGRSFALQESSRCFGFFLAPLIAGCLGGILKLQLVFVVIGLLGLIATNAIRLQIRNYRKGEEMMQNSVKYNAKSNIINRN